MNRVWIYQADRFLSSNEVSSIEQDLKDFVASWTAHGSALAGRAEIKDKLFIVIEVDESVAGVTGCSIDKSVHFLKSLGSKYQIDFFNRMNVAFKDHSGNVELLSRAGFEKALKEGVINSDTLVYNNLIQSSSELSKWIIPFKDSWHAKVF